MNENRIANSEQRIAPALPAGPYNPTETEARILATWLTNKYYKPEYSPEHGRVLTGEAELKADNRQPFTIILPPPNANGNLHLGHMSGYAYQDIMARFHRMKGKKVLLLPGKDHAGIQTEVVFERELEKEGTSKQEIGREEFYQRCYDFCMQQAATARQQEMNVGLSADFDRELFTLDPRVVSEVLEAFRLMYKDGLIYRGKRLINWCVRCQSALADIDTEFKDAKTNFVYFKYAFTQPEEGALKLKQEYAGKEIEFKFERDMTSSGQAKLPFAYGQLGELNVMAMGFNHGSLTPGQMVKAKAIGVQMRMDNQFRLVVVNPEFSGDLSPQLAETFMFELPYYVGPHIILFADYPDDKHYTNGFILGTVRPETKFGDTALAVHPDDKRYESFVGRQFKVQTLNGTSEITIIADKAVDKDFGTGMVKVTPAHAAEDWDIAQRHPAEAMPEKQVIDFHGKMNHLTGKYAGMSVNEARRQITEDMKAIGMLVHLDENYENRIRICERCKSRVEPLISYQWFVDTKPLKEKAKELVTSGATNIMPEGQLSRYMQWMDSPEDWCITRQLWWGYRIPVWYKGEPTEYVDENGQVQEKIGDTIIKSKEDYSGLMHVGGEKPDGEWIQDEDVLDTWFSSGQWPFVTLKVNGDDLDNHYPTQVMETGWDILIFWVTRMMMLNPYRAEKAGAKTPTDQTPFKDVYLHGLVLDKEGVKMSKSKGNGIDPFEMMQKYGTDALRFSFVIGNAAGQNYRLYEEKIDANRKFANKIWNATRFVLGNLEGYTPGNRQLTTDNLSIDTNKALLTHTNQVIADVTRLIETFQFGIAAQVLHNEFWHTFADIHVEAAKPHVYTQKDKETGAIISEPQAEEKAETQAVLYYALRSYVQLLHPFIPFITEEIWSHLPKLEGDPETIMYSKWPKTIK